MLTLFHMKETQHQVGLRPCSFCGQRTPWMLKPAHTLVIWKGEKIGQ
jgi:hypothetical protein